MATPLSTRRCSLVVEHRTVNPRVAGSSPANGASFSLPFSLLFLFSPRSMNEPWRCATHPPFCSCRSRGERCASCLILCQFQESAPSLRASEIHIVGCSAPVFCNQSLLYSEVTHLSSPDWQALLGLVGRRTEWLAMRMRPSPGRYQSKKLLDGSPKRITFDRRP